jgi:hypothetical protein
MSQVVRLVKVSVSRESRRCRKVEPLRRLPRMKSGFSMGCVFVTWEEDIVEPEAEPVDERTDRPDQIEQSQEDDPFFDESGGGVFLRRRTNGRMCARTGGGYSAFGVCGFFLRITWKKPVEGLLRRLFYQQIAGFEHEMSWFCGWHAGIH